MIQAADIASENVTRTILFTDLVGSTNRKLRLGDATGALIIAKHDTLFRLLLERYGGMEVDTAGDGFFSLFDDPQKAVLCALDFQSQIRKLDVPERLPARVGIHTGSLIRMPGGGTGGQRDKYVGVAIDLAYRTMGLAQGGQILLTAAPFDAARDKALKGPNGEEIEWRAHGGYLVKSFDDPIEIFEVGIAGVAPLKAPAGGDDAQRNVAFGDEITLGWRPAAGIEVPGKRGWMLERRIGQGGFGEVWTARSQELRETRAFKFCFLADRVRWLKREFTLLRLIKEHLGERDDIARLYDVRLESPPFYLETQYSPSGDLAAWATKQGGIDKVSFETRLLLAAQTADALAAAHSLGIIHKDVKPGNILIEETRTGSVQARLTDFGIGTLVNRGILKEPSGSGFTAGGTFAPDRTSGSGTRVYMAPELMAGGEATIQTDIYALGVLLFQFAVGNLERPVGMGWEAAVPDEFLREDIALCLSGNPAARLSNAGDLALRLRDMERRRARRHENNRLRLQAERGQKMMRAFAFGGSLALTLLLAAGAVVFRERKRVREANELQLQANAALQEAQAALKKAGYEEYLAKLQFAASAVRENRVDVAEQTLLSTPEPERHWGWGYLMRMTHQEWVTLAGHTGGLTGAWFSRDGIHILTTSDDKTARIWDAETGREVAVCRGHSDRIFHGSISPDGTRVVTASGDGTARIWGIDGKELFRLQHGACVNKARWSPEGSRILTASDNGNAAIWDASTGLEIHQLRGHRDQVFDAKFDATGDRVVSGSNDMEIRIWNAASGEPERILIGHHAAITAVEFSPDGKYVLSCADEAPVILWDSRTGEKLFSTEEIHRKVVRVAKFSKDGRRFATAGDDTTILIWDTETHRKILHIDRRHTYEVHDVALGPEGFKIFSASKDKTVGYFIQKDVPDGPAIDATIFAGHEGFVETVEYSPDFATAVSASSDGTAKIWRPNPSPIHFAGKGEYPDVAFSADNKFVALPYASPAERIRGSRAAARLGRPDGPPEPARCVALSCDGTILATGLRSGEIVVQGTDSNSPGRRFLIHDSEIRSLSFMPGEKELLSASLHGQVKITNLSDGRTIRELGGPGGKIERAALSPDASRMATAGEDAVRVWDMASAKELLKFEGHTPSHALSVCFSPDGKLILSTAFDTPVLLWDRDTGAVVQKLVGHADRLVWNGCFSPDGQRIATAGGDATVKLWDTSTGREILTIRDLTEPAGAIQFSPDGRSLASITYGGSGVLRQSIPWAEIRLLQSHGMSFREALYEWERRDYAADRAELRALEGRIP